MGLPRGLRRDIEKYGGSVLAGAALGLIACIVLMLATITVSLVLFVLTLGHISAEPLEVALEAAFWPVLIAFIAIGAAVSGTYTYLKER